MHRGIYICFVMNRKNVFDYILYWIKDISSAILANNILQESHFALY